MKLYGSLQNRMMEGMAKQNIEVGTGVTELCYSDRHPYEVVKVIDEKHLIIRACKATRIDNNEMSDCQEYSYELNKDDRFDKKLVLTKKGWRERVSNGKLSCNNFAVGYKEEYYDYSF